MHEEKAIADAAVKPAGAHAITYVNGVFHTMENEHDAHRSMTVENGVILGFDDVPTGGKTVDLGGEHVFPALIDAHLHLLDTVGLSGISHQLCSVEGGLIEPHELAGVEKLIRDYAARDDVPIIACNNYIASGIREGRLPNRRELDAWSAGKQVWVLSIDGHSSSCSSALLQALNLEEQAPDGILTGMVHDANMGNLTGHIASCITPAILGSGIADFSNLCASYGIGCICALDGTDDSQKDSLALMMARLARRFQIDVREFPQYMDEKKLSRMLPYMAKKCVGGCMKWQLDGSVGSHTAAFSQPFKDGGQGELYYSDEFLSDTIERFDKQGFLVTAHAIGDVAIDQLVGIYETMQGRHRIDHCEFPTDTAVEAICRLKPFVTVQPGYSWMDKRYMHGYECYLDDSVRTHQVPLRTLAEAGVPLCGSSDSPVQTVDPFLQMRGMREFYVEEESLSAFQALSTYTVNGGLMLGEKKGVLRPGFEASFFTIDCDLLTCAPAALEGLHAQNLYLHGEPYKPMKRGMGALAQLLRRRARKI